MSVPEKCSVLVVGGGPGGSYSASALAREGVDVVLLEADVFPRYHIGESMLASMRHFLRFIDLDSTFDKYGFIRKHGAAFKLNEKKEGYTDFIAAGGPENYSWNVIRSEADDLMFKHAGKSGAKTFDGTKVQSLEFVPLEKGNATMNAEAGKPVSATWSRKDGSTGVVKFDYLIDASGRAGIVSTKYLKNRKHNQGLRNVASWGYWTGAQPYTPKASGRTNQPFFESLSDASGWCWKIPLHNGTTSIGIVQNQEIATQKKKAMGSPSSKEFYLESLKLAPSILDLLSKGELTTNPSAPSQICSASDWSYSASSYASPNVRIVGDAGCFIDPYFSSGVHLALSSALSAATTIRAAQRGDCDESQAAKWHSKKVSEGYTRFLLVVLSALKQIRKQDEPVLSDWDEDGFDRAFAFFRPIIQGQADTSAKLTQGEISKTLDFCLNAFQPTEPAQRDAVLEKVDGKNPSGDNAGHKVGKPDESKENLSDDELQILKTIRARQMLRTEDTINIDNFSADSIEGMVPVVKKGSLGLVPALQDNSVLKAPKIDLFALHKNDAEVPMQEVKAY